MLIDTHCHIPMIVQHQKLDSDTTIPLKETEIHQVQEVINDAKHAGVTLLITIGTNVIESTNCCLLASRYKEIYASVGLYPHECTDSWQHDLYDIKKLIDSNEKIIAIGECGLDYHRPSYNKARQHDAFKAHIEVALQYKKALVIHTLDASDDTWNIVESYKHNLKRAVFHCFSENLDFAQEVVSRGYYIGIPCTITYPKNEKLRTIVSTCGLNSVVLETDAPYIPPQHVRGKLNHPRNIAVTAQYIAQLLEISLDDVAQTTTKNAKRLFGLINT